MIKRRADRFGSRVKDGGALWRKLRTYRLVTGSSIAPSRASLLNAALPGAIQQTDEAVMCQHRSSREEIDISSSTRPGEVAETSQQDVELSSTSRRTKPSRK
ncbi:hypothetical protein PHYPSEUDO_001751 [Phytophthora pseudosyringae]|uniref:Uncharacterized protein n=1 Tax=Phytophthora pseudosyringae TaxID=221518 RepID=A0A8T1VZ27_9STRA|nr:hypothetical protein PHYPSEUDO_001751 [Phytophthora pseudosyringae]